MAPRRCTLAAEQPSPAGAMTPRADVAPRSRFLRLPAQLGLDQNVVYRVPRHGDTRATCVNAVETYTPSPAPSIEAMTMIQNSPLRIPNPQGTHGSPEGSPGQLRR